MNNIKRKEPIEVLDVGIILALLILLVLVVSVGWAGSAYILERLAPRVTPCDDHTEPLVNVTEHPGFADMDKVARIMERAVLVYEKTDMRGVRHLDIWYCAAKYSQVPLEWRIETARTIYRFIGVRCNRA